MKKAMVTGASEGIGRAFAVGLAKAGFNVTAIARNEIRLKELVKILGSSHDYLVADLSTEEGITHASQRLGENHYDLLINNAGIGAYGNFYELPLSKLQEMTRLNCDAIVSLSHAFLESARSGDSLINVSSTLAFLPMPMLGVYSATKAFVTSFSEALWYEQRSRGVYVMNLCPGVTETSFNAHAGNTQRLPPKALAQSPEAVVATALKALKARRTPTIISGGKNNIMTSFTRFLPRKTTVKMMGRIG